MTKKDWDAIMQIKRQDRLRLSQIQDRLSGTYIAGASPKSIGKKYDYGLPCTKQNEIDDSAITQIGNALGSTEN